MNRLTPLTLLTILVVAAICSWAIHNNVEPNVSEENKVVLAETSLMRRRATVIRPFAREPTDPLPLCGGDCDRDEDCEEGLKCMQRRDEEPVPGCDFPDDGRVFSSLDVCIVDENYTAPTAAPSVSPAPTTAPPPTLAPTAIGTNSWAQTWGTTDAFNFLGPPSTQAPTTEREGREDWSWLLNYTDPQHLQFAGNNGEGPFPLGPCQSDCDGDYECAGPLECFQRNGAEPVPGCLGEDESGDDFCVWPEGFNATEAYSEFLEELEEERATPNPWEEGFCLKLYWQEGYNWQNETIERKWCISRDYQGTEWTGKCWYGLDEIDCDPDEMYINKCDHYDERQRFNFVPVSSDEVLIQAYRSNGEPEDRCFHRENRKIKLQPCNEASHNQRWFAIRGGFNDDRFELSQKTLSDDCVNQDHHPKYGEVMRMHDCEKTRGPNHLTSWWVVY